MNDDFSFIHDFMEGDGIPQALTSEECMWYWLNCGYSLAAARGKIGYYVSRGMITCISVCPKTYI